jgi:ribose transport system ATP-binding protein
MEDNARTILRMRGIVKEFGGVRALDHVDFDVREGEVHALIGENGAGKSTLMNVLAGRFSDYGGHISFFGEDVRLTNPRQALAIGIGVIYQELSVLRNLTVGENILLGHEPSGRLPGTLNRSSLREQAQAVLDHLHFDLPVDQPVGNLSHARQCLVEIAHAIREDVRVLVFDEPTASLGSEDVKNLFEVIRSLKSKGISVIYISHRLAELSQIADRVTVLRDGKVIGTRDTGDCTVSGLSLMMLGRSLGALFPEKRNAPGRTLLRVEGLTRRGVFHDISFELREGEILGIAGLVGSGRTEIVRAIFGAGKGKGQCRLGGKEIRHRSPRRCKALGIGMIQEDRNRDGIIPRRSVSVNLGIGILDRLSGVMGFLSARRMKKEADAMIERMRIVPPDPDKEIQLLSGGNQQKVMVGRWLSIDPKVIIFDEPTHGIDVGTKVQVYSLMMDLACEGRGILLISSEFVELVSLADRILVIWQGRLVRELPGPGSDVDALFAECVGKGNT